MAKSQLVYMCVCVRVRACERMRVLSWIVYVIVEYTMCSNQSKFFNAFMQLCDSRLPSSIIIG